MQKKTTDAQRTRDELSDVDKRGNEIKCEMHDIKCMLGKLLGSKMSELTFFGIISEGSKIEIETQKELE